MSTAAEEEAVNKQEDQQAATVEAPDSTTDGQAADQSGEAASATDAEEAEPSVAASAEPAEPADPNPEVKKEISEKPHDEEAAEGAAEVGANNSDEAAVAADDAPAAAEAEDTTAAPEAEAAEAEGERQPPADGDAAAPTDAEAGEGDAQGEGEGETAAKGEGEEAVAADGEAGDAEKKAEGEGAEAGVDAGDAEGEAAGEGAERADGEEAADAEAGGAEPKEESGADGEAKEERAESPARASEKLSREPTPTADEANRHPDRIDEEEEEERPEPTTPQLDEAEAPEANADLVDEAEEAGEPEEEEEDDYEEEEVEEEEYDREFMIEKYKQALAEREQKLQHNNLLQTKLSDYFRRKKADQAAAAGADAQQETEKSITDQEQRYAKFVFHLEELRKSRDLKRQEFDEKICDLELECQSREEEVRRDFEQLLAIKRKVGSKAVSATNGRPFPTVSPRRAAGPDGTPLPKSQDMLNTSVDDMLQEEADMEDQVIKVRLENISLTNRVHKCESSLKDKEELSEGLHMIDFEQLKIENQTYNEKIEERQEELLKLKKKITNNVQILTHLKEKLQFVQTNKQEQHDALQELDEHLSKRRDQLTHTKQARDSLRNDNQRLKQNSGLLGNEPLLRNFEDNVDLVVDKKKRLEQLKLEQADLSLKCDKLKAKIREANRLQGVQ